MAGGYTPTIIARNQFVPNAVNNVQAQRSRPPSTAEAGAVAEVSPWVLEGQNNNG